MKIKIDFKNIIIRQMKRIEQYSRFWLYFSLFLRRNYFPKWYRKKNFNIYRNNIKSSERKKIKNKKIKKNKKKSSERIECKCKKVNCKS